MSKLQQYNGMDTIATFQLWQEFKALLAKHPYAQLAYSERKALNAPAMYAMLRGILVDQKTVRELRTKFLDECKLLESMLDKITRKSRLGCINLGSPSQVIWMLECFGATVPRSRSYKAKGSKSVGAESLQLIANGDWELAPICNILLAWRTRATMLNVLRPNLVDRDGRMRTFYKVAGTRTTRFSSGNNSWSDKRKKGADGKPLSSGMNMQNLKRDENEAKVGHASIRSAFAADIGCKFANIDLERADSWNVALETFRSTGDRRYLDGCAQADLHTFVAKLIWPDLAWTGDPVEDRAVAETFCFGHHKHRDLSKNFQHGSNYYGRARTIALQHRIPVALAEKAQRAYFQAFPAIRKWHGAKAMELQTRGYLVNLLGQRRNFHGRLDEDSTLREAIAWCGQSATASVINRALMRIFACQIQMPDLGLEFLAQVHDSVLVQFPEENEQEALALLREVMPVPITVTSPQGKTLTRSIPLEFAVGWNWASRTPTNPDGLVKLKPGQTDDRQRQRNPEAKTPRLMDRRLSSLY